MDIALDFFDDFVHREFAPWILQSKQSISIPYRQTLVAGCPFVWSGFDVFSTFGTTSLQHSLRLCAPYFCNWCFIFPLCLRISVLCWIQLHKLSMQRDWTACLVTPVCIFLAMIMQVCLYQPMRWLNVTYTSNWPLLAWAATLLMLTLLVFRRSLLKARARLGIKTSKRAMTSVCAQQASSA